MRTPHQSTPPELTPSVGGGRRGVFHQTTCVVIASSRFSPPVYVCVCVSWRRVMPLPRLFCDHHELLHPTGFVAGLTCHPRLLASPHSCCCQRGGQRRPTRPFSPPAWHARPGPRSVKHTLRRYDDEPYSRRMTLSIQVRRTPHAHIHTRTKTKNSTLSTTQAYIHKRLQAGEVRDPLEEDGARSHCGEKHKQQWRQRIKRWKR